MELKVSNVKNGVELKISQPFQPFETDCDKCDNFGTTTLSYPSGKCLLHNFSCGYGFTCKDFKKRGV